MGETISALILEETIKAGDLLGAALIEDDRQRVAQIAIAEIKRFAAALQRADAALVLNVLDWVVSAFRAAGIEVE